MGGVSKEYGADLVERLGNGERIVGFMPTGII